MDVSSVAMDHDHYDEVPTDDDRDQLLSGSEEDVPTEGEEDDVMSSSQESTEVGDDETPTDEENGKREEDDQGTKMFTDEAQYNSGADTDNDEEEEKDPLKKRLREARKGFALEFPDPIEYIADQPALLSTKEDKKKTVSKNTKKTVRIAHPITREEKKRHNRATFDQIVASFVKEKWLPIIEGLILGPWDRDYGTEYPAHRLAKAIKLLSQNKEGLKRLKGIFVGDIPATESSKLSWIQLCDVTPLLASFPALTHFKIRGAAGLEFMPVTHSDLRSLTVECTNMSGKALRGICQSFFPSLERLELWLGTEDQEADWEIDDLLPLLRFPAEQNRFPNLKFLALKNTTRTNELVPELLESDLMDQLEVLDLSMGTLSNLGATHLQLLNRFPRLQALNIRHHFCTDLMIQKINAAAPRLRINHKNAQPPLKDEQETDPRRYVEVPE